MGYITPYLQSAKPALIEAIGTFLLVLIGTSVMVAINISGQAFSATVILMNVLAFAGTLGWLVFVFGRYSGGHFNPAVSVYCWLRGRLSSLRLASYLVSQLTGAVVASILVALLYGPAAISVKLGAPYPATSMGSWAAVIAEAIGTTCLLIAVTKAQQLQSPERQGWYVALGLALGQLLSTGVSGGSLNPARALAPQIVAGDASNWWVYWTGPMAAALAVVAVVVVWDWLDRQSQTHLVSAEPLAALATQSLAQSQPPLTADQPSILPDSAEDDQSILEQKARQALAQLQASAPDSHPQAIPQPDKVMTPPLSPEPSFQPLAKSEPVSAPTVLPEEQPHTVTPAPVRFVNFDLPTPPAEEEDQPE